MATKFQKQVKAFVEEQAALAEKIVCKSSGAVEVKHSFFYRHGYSAEKYAAKVGKALSEAGMAVKVEGRDDWAAWPKDSYFVAIVTPVEVK